MVVAMARTSASPSSCAIASTTCARSTHEARGARAIARETMEIYAPLANRWGCGSRASWRSELPLPRARGLRRPPRRPDETGARQYIADVRKTLRPRSPNRVPADGRPGTPSIWRKMKSPGVRGRADPRHDRVRVLVESVSDRHGSASTTLRTGARPLKDHIALPAEHVPSRSTPRWSVQGASASRSRSARRDAPRRGTGIAAQWKYKENTAAAWPRPTLKNSVGSVN
jgi:GTP pyrophosphokinase